MTGDPSPTNPRDVLRLAGDRVRAAEEMNLDPREVFNDFTLAERKATVEAVLQEARITAECMRAVARGLAEWGINPANATAFATLPPTVTNAITRWAMFGLTGLDMGNQPEEGR